MTSAEIIELLPFEPPFLFVDELEHVDENGVKGNFTFREDLFFYKGHFRDNPVTPGTILIETMAQIGGVCLAIFIEKGLEGYIATSVEHVDFLKPVFPNEKVTVISRKVYGRFSKLKYEVKMYNEKEELVAQGILTGMLRKLKE